MGGHGFLVKHDSHFSNGGSDCDCPDCILNWVIAEYAEGENGDPAEVLEAFSRAAICLILAMPGSLRQSAYYDYVTRLGLALQFFSEHESGEVMH